MPLSRVQQEKPAFPNTACQVFCVTHRASKSHVSIAVLSLLPAAVPRQWMEQCRAARHGAAAAGAAQWGWCHAPLALLMQTGNLLGSFTPSGLHCKTGICQAAWLFLTGLAGQERAGESWQPACSTPRSASSRGSGFPAEPFPREEVKLNLTS